MPCYVLDRNGFLVNIQETVQSRFFSLLLNKKLPSLSSKAELLSDGFLLYNQSVF